MVSGVVRDVDGASPVLAGQAVERIEGREPAPGRACRPGRSLRPRRASRPLGTRWTLRPGGPAGLRLPVDLRGPGCPAGPEHQAVPRCSSSAVARAAVGCIVDDAQEATRHVPACLDRRRDVHGLCEGACDERGCEARRDGAVRAVGVGSRCMNGLLPGVEDFPTLPAQVRRVCANPCQVRRARPSAWSIPATVVVTSDDKEASDDSERKQPRPTWTAALGFAVGVSTA